MSGSALSVEGLLARAAYRPSQDDTSLALPDVRGLLIIWAPIFFFVLLSLSYFANPLKHIPIAKAPAQSLSEWVSNLLHEPKAPEISQFLKTTYNKGLLRYKGLLGGQRVLVTSLEGFHEVLQEKSYIFHKWDVSKRILGPLMGDGMLLAEGDAHKVMIENSRPKPTALMPVITTQLQRKTISPAFAPRYIKELQPVFWRKTAELISALTKECRNGDTPLNFTTLSSRATLDILSLGIFGEDLEMLKNPDNTLIKAYAQLFAPDSASSLRSTLGVILPRKVLQALPLKRNTEINELNTIIRDYIRPFVLREKELQSAGDNAHSLSIVSVGVRSQIFNVEELIDGLMTILVAGHETTGHPLSWAIHYLCKNPQMQDRLREEIRHHLPSPDSGKSFEPGCLDNLPYLNAVCDEALRLMPVIPVLYRQAAEATTVLGSPIPAGTVIALSPFAINRSKDLWGKDADNFKPERWLGESNPTKGGKFSKYSFSPFSHGPRQCVGVTFAHAELAALLAGIVGSFECRLGDREPELKFGLVTAKPVGGIQLRLKRLEW